MLPVTTADLDVLKYAADHGYILVTCNRDDFVRESAAVVHAGIIVINRRRSRLAERAKLIALLDRAGDAGIKGNINFA